MFIYYIFLQSRPSIQSLIAFDNYCAIKDANYFSSVILVFQDKDTYYLLSCLDSLSNNIIYLYLYALTSYSTSSYILLMKHWYFLENSSYLFIDIISFNKKALSLYSWLGYCIIGQKRQNLLQQKVSHLALVNSKIRTKNLYRRYLILKDLFN